MPMCANDGPIPRAAHKPRVRQTAQHPGAHPPGMDPHELSGGRPRHRDKAQDMTPPQDNLLETARRGRQGTDKSLREKKGKRKERDKGGKLLE